MEEIRQQVQDVFREVFEDPTLLVSDRMTAEDIDGWDSIAHINLIVAIEKRLGVRFATAEISRMKQGGANVGTLVELLGRKLNPSQ
jgi:acyl carrier protein